MLKTSDGTQIKRLSGKIGDRQPALGGRKQRALYTATGGETSIDLSLLTPSLSYTPSANQISVKRTSGSGLIAGIDFYERTATSIGFPTTDPLLAGEIVEIMLDFGITSVMALAPRPDCFSQTATAGQTLITADFSWTYNLNPSKALGGVRVEINGITQTRGIDFTEVNLSNTNTNQVLLVDALLGGENIILTPVYQAIDTSAASTSFYGQAYSNMQSAFTAGTQAFIDQSSDMISVPNTTIVNRAKIPNIANDLRASLGNERIAVQSIIQLQNEFGPNGEPVFSVLNDDRGLVRCVGIWIGCPTSNLAYGQYLGANLGDYAEITFYGTGLNLLSIVFLAQDIRITVDGGTEGSSIWPSNPSNVLGGRNYSSNAIVPLVSGLTLGIHTVKIRAANANGIYISGFEILNSNASGLVNINPGVGYINGQKYTNNLVDSVAYNAGVTGTKGGRLVRYLNSDGTFGQAFQATDASTLYLSSAVHTNEEVARVYHWREFGCGRNTVNAGQANDDFSSLQSGAASRASAFTLDDGTTSLVGNYVAVTTDAPYEVLALYNGSFSQFLTITFVGTGLDIFTSNDGTRSFTAIYVDGGASIGSITSSSSAGFVKRKIVSGLPYGTHTVKLENTNLAAGSLRIIHFIVYQPKKPAVPSSSIEICDYNVAADYVASTVSTLGTVASGTMRKVCARELVYVGTWVMNLSATNHSGWYVASNTSTSYFTYTFFGSGIELSTITDAAALNQTFYIDNVATGTTANNVIQPGSGLSMTAGVLSGTSSAAGTIRYKYSGLALGVHTIKVVNNTGTYMYADALDIITPIHSYKSNLYADLQNTLTVGSNSLMDSRKTSMIKELLPAQKAWVQALGVANSPTTTSTALVPCPDMSVTIKTNGSAIKVDLSLNVIFATGAELDWCLYVDGVLAVPMRSVAPITTGYFIYSESLIIPVSQGVHKVDLYWASGGGQTLTLRGGQRILTVQEI